MTKGVKKSELMYVDKLIGRMEFCTKAEADRIIMEAVAFLANNKQPEERKKWIALNKAFGETISNTVEERKAHDVIVKSDDDDDDDEDEEEEDDY